MFFSLTNLQTLELRENLLKTLPSSLSSLVKLQTLDLGSNMFDELVSWTNIHCYLRDIV
jgi:protein scribble